MSLRSETTITAFPVCWVNGNSQRCHDSEFPDTISWTCFTASWNGSAAVANVSHSSVAIALSTIDIFIQVIHYLPGTPKPPNMYKSVFIHSLQMFSRNLKSILVVHLFFITPFDFSSICLCAALVWAITLTVGFYLLMWEILIPGKPMTIWRTWANHWPEIFESTRSCQKGGLTQKT